MSFTKSFSSGKVALSLATLIVLPAALIGAFRSPFHKAEQPQSVISPQTEQPLQVQSALVAAGKDDSQKESIPQKLSDFVLAHTIQRGETLSSIWEKNGGDHTDAILIANVIRKVGLSIRDFRPGEVLALAKAPTSGELVGLRRELPEGKTLIVRRTPDEEFSSEIIQPKIISNEKVVRGIVSGTLAASALAQDVPYSVIDEFIDLFGGRVEFRRDIQPGDSYSVTYDERYTAEGRTLTPGPIRAASLMNNGKLIVAIRYVGTDGRARYYDRHGEILGNFFLRYPVKFTRISSVFSDARLHPVLRVRRPHNGVDFAAPTGTPVRTVADGTVVASGYTRANGNWVKVRHTERWSTAYLHLSKIERGIRVGAKVARGEQIGRVGSTGYATGPHLHFSLYDRGKYVDPTKTQLPKMPENGEHIPNGLLQQVVSKLKKNHLDVQMALSDKLESTKG